MQRVEALSPFSILRRRKIDDAYEGILDWRSSIINTYARVLVLKWIEEKLVFGAFEVVGIQYVSEVFGRPRLGGIRNHKVQPSFLLYFIRVIAVVPLAVFSISGFIPERRCARGELTYHPPVLSDRCHQTSAYNSTASEFERTNCHIPRRIDVAAGPRGLVASRTPQLCRCCLGSTALEVCVRVWFAAVGTTSSGDGICLKFDLHHRLSLSSLLRPSMEKFTVHTKATLRVQLFACRWRLV